MTVLKRIIVVLSCGCVVCLPAPAQQPELLLDRSGVLSWTNASTNAHFTLQWAPQLDGNWRNWTDYEQAPVTNASMSVDIPAFFRLSLNTNVNRYVPPEGKVLMIVGQDTNNIDQYVAANGVVPGGVMLYTSVQGAEGLTSPFADGGGTQYGQYLANKYTNCVLQIGLYMVDALQGVTSGAYNANLDTIGNWIRSKARPTYLRIGYEFDADWTHYNPAQYVAAYRYIVDRFRAGCVSNVAYVWHSQGATMPTNRMVWYPGDGYVDWVGVSVFGSPSLPNRTNVLAVVEIAREHHKPLMIAEASPHGITAVNGTGSWSDWFDPVFEFIRDYDVKAFSYINMDWDAPEMWQFNTFGWGDCRVQSDPNTQILWLHEMYKSRFLQASTNLFSQLR
jgi:hypothetical protein